MTKRRKYVVSQEEFSIVNLSLDMELKILSQLEITIWLIDKQ